MIFALPLPPFPWPCSCSAMVLGVFDNTYVLLRPLTYENLGRFPIFSSAFLDLSTFGGRNVLDGTNHVFLQLDKPMKRPFIWACGRCKTSNEFAHPHCFYLVPSDPASANLSRPIVLHSILSLGFPVSPQTFFHIPFELIMLLSQTTSRSPSCQGDF